MPRKKILDASRIRRIKGGFSFIPHRFLTDGFVDALGRDELLLYLFLVLASDRYGLSYYSAESICSMLGLTPAEYRGACRGLIERDLIASDGQLFQVLELPATPAHSPPDAPEKLNGLLRKIGKEFP